MSDKEPSEEAKQLQKILNDRVRTFDVREHGMIAYAAGELKIIDAALQQARREQEKEDTRKWNVLVAQAMHKYEDEKKRYEDLMILKNQVHEQLKTARREGAKEQAALDVKVCKDRARAHWMLYSPHPLANEAEACAMTIQYEAEKAIRAEAEKI